MPCRYLKSVSSAAGAYPLAYFPQTASVVAPHLPLAGILKVQAGERSVVEGATAQLAVRLEIVSRLMEAWRTGVKGCIESIIALHFLSLYESHCLHSQKSYTF